MSFSTTNTNSDATNRSTGPRTSVTVTCSACNAETTVPFTPTPGRPVYCRPCFMKRGPAPTSRGPAGAGRGASRFASPPPQPKKKMLSQGRKAHFVYDSLEALEAEGNMDETRRRGFVEMLFTRGARQSTEAAREFIDEKVADSTLTEEEATRLQRLVDRYSQRR